MCVDENVLQCREHFKRPSHQLCLVSRTDEGSRRLKLPRQLSHTRGTKRKNRRRVYT